MNSSVIRTRFTYERNLVETNNARIKTVTIQHVEDELESYTREVKKKR